MNLLQKSVHKHPITLAVLSLTSIFFLVSRGGRPSDAYFASSVVKVVNPAGTSGGTGWSTKYHGYNVIVTNDHVCNVEKNGFVTIEEDNGSKHVRAILKRAPTNDLCIVDGISVPALPLASYGPVRFEQLYVMGHPLLNPTTPSSGQYISNIIASIGKRTNADGTCPDGSELVNDLFFSYCIVTMELSYTTVVIYPGNSGSPVINSSGEVVGVMNAASNTDNRGLFIPLEALKATLGEN